MKGTIRLVGSIFALLGTAMLAVAGFSAANTQRFVANANHGEAVIVALEGSDTTAPVFEFTAPDGRHLQVRSKLSSSPPAFAVGERVPILYAPRDPDDARIDSFLQLWFLPTFLGGMGALFGGVGYLTLYLPWRRARIAHALRHQGRPLLAEFDRVEQDPSFSVNDQHPWRIHVRWRDPATGQEHLFRSEHLWMDPTPSVREQVTVYVDPRNLSRYHVDVSYLPIVHE